MPSDEERKILDELGSEDDGVIRVYPTDVSLSVGAQQTVGFSILDMAGKLGVDPKLVQAAVKDHSRMYLTRPSGTLWIILNHPKMRDIGAAIIKIPSGEWRVSARLVSKSHWGIVRKRIKSWD